MTTSGSLLGEEYGEDLVTIFAGTKRKKFVIHKKLLLALSDYLKAALDGDFEESHAQEIYLDDADPSSIELLMRRMYRGKFPDELKAMREDARLTDKLVHLYILADKLLLATDIKIEILDWIVDIQYSDPSPGHSGLMFVMYSSTVSLMLAGTQPDDPIRLVFLDLYMIASLMEEQLGCERGFRAGLTQCINSLSGQELIDAFSRFATMSIRNVFDPEQIVNKYARR